MKSPSGMKSEKADEPEALTQCCEDEKTTSDVRSDLVADHDPVPFRMGNSVLSSLSTTERAPGQKGVLKPLTEHSREALLLTMAACDSYFCYKIPFG